jgi:hypothetical protein
VLRLILLGLAFFGATLLALQVPPVTDIQPFPGANLTVRLKLESRFGGDYRIQLSLPIVGQDAGLPSETFPCEFTASIERDGVNAQAQRIKSIVLVSELGWAHTRQYAAGDPFRLVRGTYYATIVGGAGCPAATARGASVSIEKQEREHILGSIAQTIAGAALLLVGLLGLIFGVFDRRPNKSLERTREG